MYLGSMGQCGDVEVRATQDRPKVTPGRALTDAFLYVKLGAAHSWGQTSVGKTRNISLSNTEHFAI